MMGFRNQLKPRSGWDDHKQLALKAGTKRKIKRQDSSRERLAAKRQLWVDIEGDWEALRLEQEELDRFLFYEQDEDWMEEDFLYDESWEALN